MADNPYDVLIGRVGAAKPVAPPTAPPPPVDAPVTVKPALPAAGNPYATIIDAAEAGPPPTRAVLDSAGRVDADSFANARKIGGEFGVPTEVAERNIEELQARKKVLEGEQALNSAPVTKSWFERDPENAKLSHDQLSTMAGFEDAVRQLSSEPASSSVTAGDVAVSPLSGFVKTFGSMASGIAAAKKSVAGLRDQALAGMARAAGLETLAKMFEDPNLRKMREGESDALQEAGKAVKDVGEAIGPKNKNFLTDVGEGLGQVGAQITTLLLTGGVAGTGLLFAQGADQVDEDVKKAKAEGTVGGDAATLAGGAITALTEKYGLDLLIKRIPANVQSRLFRMLAGFGSEASQEILENVSNNIAAMALYDKDRTLFGDSTLYEGGVGGTVGAIVAAAIPGHRAIRRRDQIVKIAEDIQNSPLTQRAPDKAAEHAGAVLDSGPEMFVSAARLVEEAGPEKLSEMGFSDEVDRAIERGGEVKLTGEQFARLAQEGIAANLADDTRVGAGEMTAKEAKAIPDDLAEQRAQERDAQAMSEAEKAAADKPASTPEEWKPNTWQRRQLIAAGFGKEEIDGMSQQDVLDLVGEKPPSPDKWHAQAHAPVALAEDQLGLKAMFDTAAEAGMSEQQYASYLAAIEEAGDGARLRAAERAIKRQKKELTAEWNAEREVVRQQVEQSVRQEPVYSALDGIGVDRLDAEAIVEIMGQESILEILPKSQGRQIFQRKGGIHPDVMAELYGFDDGRQMIDAMMAAVPIKDKIEAETDRVMSEKHGAILDKQRDLDEAIEDLHESRAYLKPLLAELKALKGGERKGGPLDPVLFRATAAAGLRGERVRDIDPKRFLNEEARKGKLAGKLIKGRGKVDGEKLAGPNRSEAARVKFEQILNYEYARQAFQARRQVEEQRKHLAALADASKAIPAIDADHRDRIVELLSGYDFSSGFVNVPAGLRGGIHYGNMSLGAFNALYSQAKVIEEEGRKWRTLHINGAAQDFAAVKTELIDRLANLPELPRLERAAAGEVKLFDRARSVLASAQAYVSKIELLVRKLDGGEVAGPWHKAVFQPLADAQTRELDLYEKALSPIIEGAKALPKTIGNKLDFKVPGVQIGGRKFTYAELLMVAVNSGNASNFEKLIEGSEYIKKGSPKWDPAEVQAALDKLPPEAAGWVQSVWDQFEKVRPMVEEVYRSVHGISPSRIEPRSVSIGGVTVKGGYFPMVYDQTSAPPLRDSGSEAFNTMLHPADRAGVFSGMTKERSENYAAPVDLKFSNLAHSLRRHLHFVSHFETYNNVRKLMQDRELNAELVARVGPEYRDELHRWLDAVATNNADFRTSQGMNAAVQAIRTNITVGVLGLSYTTLVAQAFGIFTSGAALGQKADGKFSAAEGAKWMAIGLDRYLGNFKESVALAKEMSGEMRHRLGNADREQAEALRNTAEGTSVYSLAQRASLKAIGGMQFYVVDMPTWIGAFNQGLSRDMSERQASDYADSIVRTSQGSGHLKDQAGLQRTKGLTQWLTMFSTYITLLYGLVGESIGSAVANPKRIPAQVSKLAFLLLMPAVAEAVLRQDFPDDDDDAALAKWALKSLVYGIKSTPVVGQLIASEIEGFRGSSISPVESLTQKVSQGAKAAAEIVAEQDVELKNARKVFDAVGMAAGLPGTTQIVRMLKAIEQESDNPYDYFVTPKKN